MKTIITNISRILLSLTFILSGFVKAVDPAGTQYKIQDYAEAIGMPGILPDWMTMTASIALSTVEFTIGVLLLFAISRRVVSKLVLLFMVFMTAITVWIYVADPVSDCGCFGDAIKLSNGETLAKNIVLLALSAIVAWKPLKMVRMVSLNNQWIVFHYTIIFILGISIYSLYTLPLFDFRPYHIGANIKEGMEIPEAAELPEFETTFIMEKDGVQKEFSLDDYPDSTWTFIDSKTKVIKEGYVPPIHDFSIQQTEGDGDDITEEILDNKGFTFLLIAPHLETADDSNFGDIDVIYDYAQEHGYPFYCLTASNEDAINQWKDLTGAEYPFCTTDETTLKTIIRSSPGLVLIKDARVVGKWSHHELPVAELENTGKLTDRMVSDMEPASPAKKITYILMWYVLPLLLLVIADRLWMWSRWLKKEERTIHSNIIVKHLLKTKNNGKENCSRQLEDEQEPAGGRSSR